MAYSDYGAFVYCNNKRRKDKEDTEGVHGVIGDGDIRVYCYKQGLPVIKNKDQKIEYYDKTKIDLFDYENFSFDYQGYHFYFISGYWSKPYCVRMTEPDGTKWECEYDYGFGAGFEDE